MNITFREYQSADRELLKDMMNRLENHVKTLDPLKRIENNPGFDEISVTESLEHVEKYNGKICFAEDEGKVIGHIIGVIWEQSEKNRLEIGEHKLGEVIDLYLEEEYRGKGLGKKMLSMMEEYFKLHNCDSMWIGVFADNTSAHEMYKNFGFRDREIGMLKQL